MIVCDRCAKKMPGADDNLKIILDFTFLKRERSYILCPSCMNKVKLFLNSPLTLLEDEEEPKEE